MRQIIYHAQCKDGWCAALIALKKYPDAQLVPGFYGLPTPEVSGSDVLLVDFSYPRPVMEQLVAEAKSVTVLDHHKTAAEALNGLKGADITFDMNRSGAGITWDVLFPGEARPWFVSYVEDHDLWTHALPNTLAVNAYLSTLEFSVEAWNLELDVVRAGELGNAILSKTRQYVREVSKNAMRVIFEGHNVPLVNAPQVDISELLAALCKGEPFAMGWSQRADGSFSYSLRSEEFDVSELAKRYGGGGHHHAAGFRLLTMLMLPKA
jgi:oligoribonuclease NrnB/cAMP/cGMP phosphodiesterase (DHH superfamily)